MYICICVCVCLIKPEYFVWGFFLLTIHSLLLSSFSLLLCLPLIFACVCKARWEEPEESDFYEFLYFPYNSVISSMLFVFSFVLFCFAFIVRSFNLLYSFLFNQIKSQGQVFEVEFLFFYSIFFFFFLLFFVLLKRRKKKIQIKRCWQYKNKKKKIVTLLWFVKERTGRIKKK